MKLLSTLPTVTEDIQKICHTVHMSLNFIHPSPKAAEKVTYNLLMVSLSVVNMSLSAQCPSAIMVDPSIQWISETGAKLMRSDLERHRSINGAATVKVPCYPG
jgi:hypothetical protein